MKRELSEARDKMAADSASSDKEKAELQRQMDTMREALGVGQQRSEVKFVTVCVSCECHVTHSVTESEDKIREAEGTVKVHTLYSTLNDSKPSNYIFLQDIVSNSW